MAHTKWNFDYTNTFGIMKIFLYFPKLLLTKFRGWLSHNSNWIILIVHHSLLRSLHFIIFGVKFSSTQFFIHSHLHRIKYILGIIKPNLKWWWIQVFNLQTLHIRLLLFESNSILVCCVSLSSPSFISLVSSLRPSLIWNVFSIHIRVYLTYQIKIN